MEASLAYPIPSKEQLTSEFVGKSLRDVPLPSAILDVAKLRKNCGLMLNTVQQLQVDFRAHIKTHKTVELARMQVGDECKDVRLICSTIPELENLIPLLFEYQRKGADVNVLYGVPPGPSHISRLAQYVTKVGLGSLTLMVDGPSLLETARKVYELSGQSTIKVFLKTDSGYHRAGLAPTSTRMRDLVNATLALESQGVVHLLGFYSHNSLSYSGNSPLEAMDNLRVEIDACTQAALHNTPKDYVAKRGSCLTISCGASPTALSLQNLLASSEKTATTTSATALRDSIAIAKESNIRFEIHAGVYPTLDMQQVSAASRELGSCAEDNIAFTILSEICSTYPDRTEQPEALINAGCIALAREPCKSYRGYGVLTCWNIPKNYDPYGRENRIIVDRVSQEHGLLQWEDVEKKEYLPLDYGQRVQIWPNHACITGAHFGWYLIVDSETEDADIVRDVWSRWRGW